MLGVLVVSFGYLETPKGSHPTACPVETLELGFQIAARGEGERVIGEIVNAITQGVVFTVQQQIKFVKAVLGTVFLGLHLSDSCDSLY